MTTWDNTFAERTRGPSLTIWLITLTVLVFIVWSAFAWLEEIVRAPGQVVPSSRPQIIQNLEGGILAELNVAEGDIVEPGQVLARLYGTQYQAAVDDLSDQIAALEIRRLRLEAETADVASFDVPEMWALRVPDIVASERALLTARQSEFAAQRDGATAVLEQARAELDMMERMLEADVVPLIEVTRARKDFSDAEGRLAEAITATALDRAREYSEVQAELASLRQRLKQGEDQLRRTQLTAPLRGVVNKVSVTTIGGVVRPGEEIMQIIPLDDELYIEAKVSPTDIASVLVGQDATVKLSAYDYTIYGTLKAKVHFVSADTFVDDRARAADGNPHYKVTLSVDTAGLTERQRNLQIRPGMQATVELQTGSKTILSYLVKPLYKTSEALRER
ncbi:MAG: HlyD family type I secretion periplasmic adaptor subunit [Rhodobacteraceae bacterium]|jgi:membrane fusion protein, adhesin transport system|nr:HlyD family type I secretion periplasmic adaptor subunit [Paracoccaceae bacterium]